MSVYKELMSIILEDTKPTKFTGLRKLQALLIVHQYNFRILHWNVTGVDFDPVHELMSDYYEKLGEFIDGIVEISILSGVDVVSVFDAAKTNSDKALDSNKKYTSEEVFKHTKEILRDLIEGMDEAIEDCEHEDVKDEIKTMQFWIRKELSYKTSQRNK